MRLTKEILISIIISTKNEEKNIGRLLSSIKGQSYKNIEIIVVDNNSSDKTVEVAKKYTSNVFTKGPERSIQRNYGVYKSKGNYILILDADMELTRNVIKSCIENINGHKALIIPERTVGKSFLSKVRNFERNMYMGDATIEVARFFEKKVFNEFGGYDPNLTGTEDYDLPYRISKKYSIGWAKEWILHHEEGLTLAKQLKKKFYYASKSALYTKKHPELISTQGNLLVRRAYLRHWRDFIDKPFIAVAFIFIRALEASSAVLGYISAVGLSGFLKTSLKFIRN